MRYSNIDTPEESYDSQYSQMNQNNNINQQNQQNTDTHSNGISMLNVRNMYSLSDFSKESKLSNSNSNRINDTGYHRIEEKKTDYRQNMNNKLDNMIFDNPSAQSLSINPILQQRNGNNYSNSQKDTRMVIQDSNKDYYRQSANERMSQYSPLSRSSNIPIHMANMSVNDFYGNMGGETNEMDRKLIEEEHKKLNSKEMLNNRLNNYTPLSKTVQYETNQSHNTKQHYNTPTQNTNTPRQNTNTPTQNTNTSRQQSNTPTQNTNTQQARQHMKPQQWNPLDVNSKLQNVVYNQLPIISNSERI